MIHLPAPLSVNRYWTIQRGTGGIGPSDEGRRWKQQARVLAARQAPAGAPFSGAVMVEIVLHPPTRADGLASRVRVDLDNAAKCTLDALEGVAYTNDRQIEVLTIRLGEPLPAGGMTVGVAPI